MVLKLTNCVKHKRQSLDIDAREKRRRRIQKVQNRHEQRTRSGPELIHDQAKRRQAHYGNGSQNRENADVRIDLGTDFRWPKLALKTLLL